MWVVVASLHSRGQTGLTPELMVNCMERSLQEEGAPAKSNRSSVAGLHWEMGLDCQSHFQWSLISYFYKCLTNTAFRVVQTFLELNTQRNNIPLKFLFPGVIWLFVNFTLVIVVFLFWIIVFIYSLRVSDIYIYLGDIHNPLSSSPAYSSPLHVSFFHGVINKNRIHLCLGELRVRGGRE